MSNAPVSDARWREAQAWELGAWRQEQSHGLKGAARRVLGRERDGDDWNYWWAEQFENYACVPHDVDNYIELGCGPYTNTRIISRGRSFRHAICSDPLAREYVRFKRSWLAEQHRSGMVLVDDHPIEECVYRDNAFDVVVVINVLDHVRDPSRCLAEMTRIVKPGGILVFGQDLTDPASDPMDDDVGHPIALHETDVRPALKLFEPVLDRLLSREKGRNPEHHYATLVYAGRKRAEAAST